MRNTILLISILLGGGMLLLSGALRMSCTSDEVAHIPAGYSYLATGDFRMNLEHPPLAKVLAAAPLKLLHPRLDLDDRYWKAGEEWPFGQKFLFFWNEPEVLVFWARLPIILLTLLLAVLLYCWASELAGPETGLLAVLLLLTTPEILAHGALVTTDMAITCFMFASVYAFYRCLNNCSLINLLFFSAAFGMSQVSKFSAPLLVPMLGACALCYLLIPHPLAPLSITESRRQKLRVLVKVGGAGLLGAWIAIWACYGFRYQLSPDPRIAQMVDWGRFVEQGFVPRVVRAMNSLHLLPQGYTFGFLDCLLSIQERTGYLFGERSNSGWWYYYLVSFAIKTPLPLLLLFGWSLIQMGISWRAQQRQLIWLLPLLIYLLVAMTSKTNIGNRHILPIYPFVALAAAQVAGQSWSWRTWRTRVVLLLLLWQGATTFWIAPDYLAYFNELVGGPRNGYKYLIDSNIDWGQDLKRLAEFRDRHANEPLYVSYFGAAAPTHYLKNVHYLPGLIPILGKQPVDYGAVPRGSLVAISVTNLSGAYRLGRADEDEFLLMLGRLQPIERIGYSILVFRLP